MDTLACVTLMAVLLLLCGANCYELSSEEQENPVLFYVGEPIIDADITTNRFDDEEPPVDNGEVLIIKRALVGLSGARGFGKRLSGLSGARGFGKRDFRSLSSQGARGFGKRGFQLAGTHARGFGR